jgi:hypothetical protein
MEIVTGEDLSDRYALSGYSLVQVGTSPTASDCPTMPTFCHEGASSALRQQGMLDLKNQFQIEPSAAAAALLTRLPARLRH